MDAPDTNRARPHVLKNYLSIFPYQIIHTQIRSIQKQCFRLLTIRLVTLFMRTWLAATIAQCTLPQPGVGFPTAFPSRGQVCPSPEKNLTCVFSESFDRKGPQQQPISGKEEKNTLGPADWPELRPALPTRQGNVLSTTTPRNHHDCQGYDHNAPYCIAPSRPFPKQNLENT